MLEQKNITVKAGSSFQTVCPFPVGYIYQSYNSTSPANIYGGSWTPITGRFLYCNNGTGVGGSNTHKISIDEMPRHTHDIYSGSAKEDGTVDVYWGGNSRVARSPSTSWNSISHGEMREECVTIRAILKNIIPCPHTKVVTHGDALHKILKNK